MTILIGTRERPTTIDHRLYDHIRHFRLLDLQIRLRLQHFAHLQAVGLLVALRPRRPDGGSTRSVEQRSEEHTSELQSLRHLVCRLLLEKKKWRERSSHLPSLLLRQAPAMSFVSTR